MRIGICFLKVHSFHIFMYLKRLKATRESGQKLLSPKQAVETKQPRKRVYTLESKVSIVKQNNPL